jgi:Tfp pilus assembly protein PilW
VRRLFMNARSDAGFTLVELMIASATLLIILTLTLAFFARGQVIYTNERGTLDMVQDLRTAFDRFTNEIRMAGGGLPGYHGVVTGTSTSLIVRGDFNNATTIITSLSSISVSGSAATLPVGTTGPFAAGQTVSMLNQLTGAAALAKVTAVDGAAGTVTVDKDDLLPITSGAHITSVSDTSFSAGTILNVVERRTYSTITSTDSTNGSITRTDAYEDTQTAGGVIIAQETIARNVIGPAGGAGLSYTYLDASDNVLPIDPVTGVDATKVAKVQINLQARTADLDLMSHQYRTLNLTCLVQVRGQYVPKVGF